MVYSVEIAGRRGALWTGLFYLDDVAHLLSASDARRYGSELRVSGSRLSGLSRRGFFGLEKNEYERYKSFMDFGGVVTSRMIALLLSYGIRIGRIEIAHRYLVDKTGSEYPFASRKFWVEAPGDSREVYAELDRYIVAASRFDQLPFTRLLAGPIGEIDDMEFDDSEDEWVTHWEPVPGIRIDPRVQTGSPCLVGTRTPTSAQYGSFVGGDSVEDIAFWYDLSLDQVQVAIDWEERLAKA